MSEKIEFLSAIILISKQPEKLATFYRDVIGLPIETEQHGDTEVHYGCELGDLHFAIHPISNFEGTGYGSGSVKLAFTVFDMKTFVEKLQAADVEIAVVSKNMGFATLTALHDPDGNYVEFTQLSDRWFQHLEGRRKAGHDVVSKWQALKQ